MDGVSSGAESARAEAARLESQRRLVTVMFCDLCGYTSLSERADPEDLQALLGRIFGQASEVVERYGGHIDKFIGDAVMALFGAPESHEDDALRCVAAAREIHERVARLDPLSPELPAPAMHTGIETGVVVRGQVADTRGDATVLGDVVNIASRLGHVAKRNEIVVGAQTKSLTRGSFEYEDLGEQAVRGRSEGVRAYRLRGAKRRPSRVHTAGELATRLIGREAEMAALTTAVDRLVAGDSTLVLIRGEAGTGKSRLVEEARAACPSHVQFRSGYCYEYARAFPYYPVVDLLSRAWGITELDSPDDVRERIERSVRQRVSNDGGLGARIARLWGLDSPTLHGLDPETWRQRLPGDIGAVLSSLARSAPTMVVLEDLHWADTSSLELLDSILAQSGPGVLYLCTARPPFAFERHPGASGKLEFTSIELQEFEPDDASHMVSSLLHMESVPAELDALVREHARGNPFYLEQFVSSLVQSRVLEQSGDGWCIESTLDTLEVPAGAREMLAARFDRLSDDDRRVLTRAAVLGQAFSQDALEAIADSGDLEESLQRLIADGLLEPFGTEGHLRFRHALVKEAVYDGLLKKERRKLHEAAGRAIETLYAERLPQHYEMLALHFSEGLSEDRAVNYLVCSGEKSVERFALDQADSYFSQARTLIEASASRQGPDGELLAVDLVTRWAPVFWYRGDFLGLEGLLSEHADKGAQELPDAQRGRFAAWLGTTCWNRQTLDSSRIWLEEALRVAQETGDETTLCFAHAWLAYTLTDLGCIDEAIRHGLEARHLTEAFEDDHFLVAHSHGASAYAFWAAGETQGALEAGRRLLEHAERYSAARTTVFGLWARALGYVCDGDYQSAELAIDEALDVSSDPWTSQFPRMFAGLCCVYRDDFAGARDHLEEVLRFADSRGAATLATPARGLLGASLVGLGELNEGMAMLEQAREEFEAGHRPWGTAQAIFIIGSLHARIAARTVDVSVSTALRNVGFVIQQVPRAARRAREELEQSLRMCEEMGARGMSGRCRMELGDLASARNRTAEALRFWEEAAADFEACGADTLLEEARGRTAALTD